MSTTSPEWTTLTPFSAAALPRPIVAASLTGFLDDPSVIIGLLVALRGNMYSAFDVLAGAI